MLLIVCVHSRPIRFIFIPSDEVAGVGGMWDSDGVRCWLEQSDVCVITVGHATVLSG